jgi:hypothetical protein
MKPIALLLLAACIAVPLRAQTPSASAPTATAAKKSVTTVPAIRPPDSILPAPIGRLNTAERAAVLKNKPPMKQLPSFNVADRDGKPVAAESLTAGKHWLLLYRRQDCLPCDRLMTVLAAGGNPGLNNGLPYVILVAAKTQDGLERVRANYGTLSNATWLVDKNDEALAALKPRGTPMLYAMDGNNIAWNVPGTLGDPTRVQKMAADWIASGSTAARSSTAPAPASPSK